MIAVGAVMLTLSVSPRDYATGIFLAGLLSSAAFIWDLRRRIPESRNVRIGLTEARQGWAQLGKDSWHFWVMSLAQTANQNGIVLIVAAMLAPEMVVLYTTHRTLSNVSNFIGTVFQGPLLPEFSRLWAKDQLSELSRSVFLSIRIVVLLTGVAALLIWLSAPLLYSLWTGRHFAVHPLLLAILLIQGLLAAGWLTSGWAMMAANRHRLMAGWFLLNAILTLLLGLAVARPWGIVGIAAASLVADVLCGAIVYPRLLARFLVIRTLRVYAQIGVALIALLPALGLTLFAKAVFSDGAAVVVFLILGAMLLWPTLALALGRADFRRAFGLLLELTGRRVQT
jgi:O-antigen/teichoic acid export membrane protein